MLLLSYCDINHYQLHCLFVIISCNVYMYHAFFSLCHKINVSFHFFIFIPIILLIELSVQYLSKHLQIILIYHSCFIYPCIYLSICLMSRLCTCNYKKQHSLEQSHFYPQQLLVQQYHILSQHYGLDLLLLLPKPKNKKGFNIQLTLLLVSMFIGFIYSTTVMKSCFLYYYRK